MKKLIAALVFLMFGAASAYADLYQWKDAQGVIHITDSMEKVPQEFRERVRVYKETPPSPESGLNEAVSPPLPSDKAEELYGDQTLEWWRQTFTRKRTDIDSLQTNVTNKTQFLEMFERGRRFGQTFEPQQVAQYNIYKEELPEDLRRLAEMREELEELQRRATIAGVPKDIRGE